ncbi:hypothetical protein, unknown function, partial [Leishmania mexicana MHOM/GT/2001/U1103]
RVLPLSHTHLPASHRCRSSVGSLSLPHSSPPPSAIIADHHAGRVQVQRQGPHARPRRRTPTERALDYYERTDDDKLMAHASQLHHLSKPRYRSCLTEFTIVETPEVSCLVDSVDPSPGLLRCSGHQGAKQAVNGVG